MRSEIRNIRVVVKNGAFGNPDAVGFWIYGKRRDGRTVACKNEIQTDGGIQIWSSYSSDGPYMEEDLTEFSKDEWEKIRHAAGSEQIWVGNKILSSRPVA